MKKIIIAAIFCIVAVSANAQNYNWAIGVRGGGSDSGVTLKHILSDNNAFEVNLSYVYPFNNVIRCENLTALYEWNSPIFSDGFILYYGFGAHLGSATVDKEGKGRLGRLGAGIDGAIGIEYKLRNAPLAFSLDYRPNMNFLPGFYTFFQNVGMGIKLCF